MRSAFLPVDFASARQLTESAVALILAGLAEPAVWAAQLFIGDTGEGIAVPFPPDLRVKLLLWCDRRCCLCKKACDVFIEVHHIIPESEDGDDGEDNALPLCFECHGRVSHYDVKHPIGTKFRADELKKRREQVFEEFTRHLVPALQYQVQQHGRKLPDVGFSITHLGDAPPVQVSVTIDTYINGAVKNIDSVDSLYRGQVRWNLNPKEGVHGHFAVANEACNHGTDLRTGVNIVVHDIYDRPHKLLPVAYVYDRDRNEWWLDPVDPRVSASRAAP